MSNWLIAIAILVAVIALLIYGFFYIKRKIRNKIIEKGADIITKTTGKYLDEETASKINRATNVTAETLKEGVIKTAAKKGLEIAMDAKKNSSE
ncbi:MAG: hypothetical protein LBC64_05790 [Fibromonadaceae bacterium]|jgi:uncharacterized protein YneF (UPF0154 family)|nr:hypothetical protein [Fibromonadaceae bacterium]